MDSLRPLNNINLRINCISVFHIIAIISWLKKKKIKNSKFRPFQVFATLKCLIQPRRWYKMLIHWLEPPSILVFMSSYIWMTIHYLYTVSPVFSSFSFALGEIAEATIRNDMQGRVTFIMYFKWPGGLMPGNTLHTMLQVGSHITAQCLQNYTCSIIITIFTPSHQEGKYRTQFATRGFTLA